MWWTLSFALAGVPVRVPVFGDLTDPSGIPAEGVRAVAFRLYGAPTGGAPIWSSAEVVQFSAGAFSVSLPVDADLLATDGDLWLGIQPDGDVEAGRSQVQFAPRAGWAARAGDVETLGGASRSDLTLTPGSGLGWSSPNALAQDISAFDAAAREATFDAPSELTTALAGEYRPTSWTPAWSDIVGRPSGLDDGDDDRVYTGASGVDVTSRALSLVTSWVTGRAQGVGFESTAELTAALNSTYRPMSYVPAWSTITGRPAGLDDGDQDTTYSAGTGLGMASATLSVTSGVVRRLSTSPVTAAVMYVGNTADCNGDVLYTGPDGVNYTLAASTVAAGQKLIDPSGRIAFQAGATTADAGMLWLSIEGLNNVRCTLLANEDDGFRPALEWFTDTGNNTVGVWGEDGIATFGLRRPGTQFSPITGCTSYSVLCL